MTFRNIRKLSRSWLMSVLLLALVAAPFEGGLAGVMFQQDFAKPCTHMTMTAGDMQQMDCCNQDPACQDECGTCMMSFTVMHALPVQGTAHSARQHVTHFLSLPLIKGIHSSLDPRPPRCKA